MSNTNNQNNKKRKRKIATIALLSNLGIAAIIAALGGGIASSLNSKNDTTTYPSVVMEKTPVKKTIFVGGKIPTFMVNASANKNGYKLSYQWYVGKPGSTLKAGGISNLATYTPSSKLALNVNTSTYFCIVSISRNGNVVASSDSGIFTLDVVNQPSINFTKSYTTEATLDEKNYQTIYSNVYSDNSNVSFAYQWYKSSSSEITSPTSFNSGDLISGANKSSYTLQTLDVNSLSTNYYYLLVTASYDGNTWTELSPAYEVNVVKNATLSVTYNNSTTVYSTQNTSGYALTASITNSSNINVNYQWYTNNKMYDKATNTLKVGNETYYAINDATDSYYVLTTTDTATIGNFSYLLLATGTQNGIAISSYTTSIVNMYKVDVSSVPSINITDTNNFKISAYLNQTNAITLNPTYTLEGGTEAINNNLGYTYQWYVATSASNNQSGTAISVNGTGSSYVINPSELKGSNAKSLYYYVVASFTIDGTTKNFASNVFDVSLTPNTLTSPTTSTNSSIIYAIANETTYQTLSVSISSNNAKNSFAWYSTNPVYDKNSSVTYDNTTYYLVPNENSTSYTLTKTDVDMNISSGVSYKYILSINSTDAVTGQTTTSYSTPITVNISPAPILKNNLNDSSFSYNATVSQSTSIILNANSIITNVSSFNNYSDNDITYALYETEANFVHNNNNNKPISTNNSGNFNIDSSYFKTVGVLYFTVVASYSVNGVNSNNVITDYTINITNKPSININVLSNLSQTAYVSQTEDINFNINAIVNEESNGHTIQNNNIGLNYAWYENNTNTTLPTFNDGTIAANGWTSIGSNNASYSLNSFSTSATNYYVVVVYGQVNGVYIDSISSVMTLNILDMPTLSLTSSKLTSNSSAYQVDSTGYSANVFNGYSSPVVLNVSANSNYLDSINNLTYTWYLVANGKTTKLITSSSSAYTLNNAFSINGTYEYYCVVNGSLNGISLSATSKTYTFDVIDSTNDNSVQVNATISRNINSLVGSSLTLTINSLTSTGSANITFAWQKQDGSSWNNLSDFSYNSSYTFDTLAASDAGTYRLCVKIDNDGAVSYSYSNDLDLNVITTNSTQPKDPSKPVDKDNPEISTYPSFTLTPNNSIVSATQNETSFQTLSSNITIYNPLDLSTNIKYQWTRSGSSSVLSNINNYTLTSSDVSSTGTFTYTLTAKLYANNVLVDTKTVTYTVTVSATPTLELSTNKTTYDIYYDNTTANTSSTNLLQVTNSFLVNGTTDSSLNSVYGVSYYWTLNGTSFDNNTNTWALPTISKQNTDTYTVYAISIVNGVSVKSNTITFTISYINTDTTGTSSIWNSNNSVTINGSTSSSINLVVGTNSYTITPSINISTKAGYATPIISYNWTSSSNNLSDINTTTNTLSLGSNFFTTAGSTTYTITVTANIDGAIKTYNASLTINVIDAKTDASSYPKVSLTNTNNASTIYATQNETAYQTLTATPEVTNNSLGLSVDFKFAWYTTNANYKNNNSITYDNTTYYLIPTSSQSNYTLTTNDVSVIGTFSYLLVANYSINGTLITPALYASYKVEVSSVTITKPDTSNTYNPNNPGSDGSSTDSAGTSPSTTTPQTTNHPWQNVANGSNNTTPNVSPYDNKAWPGQKTNTTNPDGSPINKYTSIYETYYAVYVNQKNNLPILSNGITLSGSYTYTWTNYNTSTTLSDTSSSYSLTNDDISSYTAGSTLRLLETVTTTINGISVTSIFIYNILIQAQPTITITQHNANISVFENSSNDVLLYVSNNLSSLNINANINLSYDWSLNGTDLNNDFSFYQVNSDNFTTSGVLTYSLKVIGSIDGSVWTIGTYIFNITVKPLSSANYTFSTSLSNLNNSKLSSNNIYYESYSTSNNNILEVSNTLTGSDLPSSYYYSYVWYQEDNQTNVITKLSSDINLYSLVFNSVGYYSYYAIVTLHVNGASWTKTTNKLNFIITVPSTNPYDNPTSKADKNSPYNQQGSIYNPDNPDSPYNKNNINNPSNKNSVLNPDNPDSPYNTKNENSKATPIFDITNSSLNVFATTNETSYQTLNVNINQTNTSFSGSYSVDYLWSKNGSSISNNNYSSYTLNSEDVNTAGTFSYTLTILIYVNSSVYESKTITYTVTVTSLPTPDLSATKTSYDILTNQNLDLITNISNADSYGVVYYWSIDGKAISNSSSSYTFSENIANSYTVSVYGQISLNGATSKSNILTFTVNVSSPSSSITGNITISNNNTSYTTISKDTNINYAISNNTISSSLGTPSLSYNYEISFENNGSYSSPSTISTNSAFTLTQSLLQSYKEYSSSTSAIKVTLIVTASLNGSSVQFTSNSLIINLISLSSSDYPTIAATLNSNGNTSYLINNQTKDLPTFSSTISVTNNTYNLPITYNYQWYKNGAAISNANSSTYTPSTTDLGSFTYTLVIIANINGNTTTIDATSSYKIDVVSKPTLSFANGTQTVDVYSNQKTSLPTISGFASFNDNVFNNLLGISYSWSNDNSNTNSSYTLTSANTSTDSTITLTATASYGGFSFSATKTFSIKIIANPSIDISSNTTSYSANVNQTSSITLLSQTTSDLSLTYNWVVSDGNTQITTSSSSAPYYTLPSSIYQNAGVYTVTLVATSDFYGTLLTSNTITYTINVTKPTIQNFSMDLSFNKTTFNALLNQATQTFAPVISNITGDNASLTYIWLKQTGDSWNAISQASANLAHTFSFSSLDVAGVYKVEYIATFSNGSSISGYSSNTLTINVTSSTNSDGKPNSTYPTVTFTQNNKVINAIVNQSVNSLPNFNVSYSVSNNNYETLSINYVWKQGNTTISDTNNFYDLTPTNISSVGTYIYTLVATPIINGVSQTSTTFSFTLNVSNLPNISLATSKNAYTLYQGANSELLNVTYSNTDVTSFMNSGTINYYWNINNSSISNNAATYNFDPTQTGTYTITVYATQTFNGLVAKSNTITFSIDVKDLASIISGQVLINGENSSIMKAVNTSAFTLNGKNNLNLPTNASVSYQWYSLNKNDNTSLIYDNQDFYLISNANSLNYDITSASANTYLLAATVNVNGASATFYADITISIINSSSYPTIIYSANNNNSISATQYETSYQILQAQTKIENNVDNINVTFSYTWTKNNIDINNNSLSYSLNANDVNTTGTYTYSLVITPYFNGVAQTTKTITWTVNVNAITTISSSNKTWTNSTNNPDDLNNPANTKSPYYGKNNVVYHTYSSTYYVYYGNNVQTTNLPLLTADINTANNDGLIYSWTQGDSVLNSTSASYQLASSNLSGFNNTSSTTTITETVKLDSNGTISISVFNYVINAKALPSIEVWNLQNSTTQNITAYYNQSSNVTLYTTNNNTNSDITISYVWYENNTEISNSNNSYYTVLANNFTNTSINSLTYTVVPTISVDGASLKLTTLTYTISLIDASSTLNNLKVTITGNYNSAIVNQDSGITLTSQVTGNQNAVLSYQWEEVDASGNIISDNTIFNALTTNSYLLNLSSDMFKNTSASALYFKLVVTATLDGASANFFSNIYKINLLNAKNVSNYSVDVNLLNNNTYNLFTGQTVNLPTLSAQTTITNNTAYNISILYSWTISNNDKVIKTTTYSSNVSYPVADTSNAGTFIYTLNYEILINGVLANTLSAGYYTINVNNYTLSSPTASNPSSTVYINQTTNLTLYATQQNPSGIIYTYEWEEDNNNVLTPIVNSNSLSYTVNATNFKNTGTLTYVLKVTSATLNGQSLDISSLQPTTFSINITTLNLSISSITFPVSTYNFVKGQKDLENLYANISISNPDNLVYTASYSWTLNSQNVGTNAYLSPSDYENNLGTNTYYLTVTLNYDGSTVTQTSTSYITINSFDPSNYTNDINNGVNYIPTVSGIPTSITPSTSNVYLGSNNVPLIGYSGTLTINNSSNWNTSILYLWCFKTASSPDINEVDGANSISMSPVALINENGVGTYTFSEYIYLIVNGVKLLPYKEIYSHIINVQDPTLSFDSTSSNLTLTQGVSSPVLTISNTNVSSNTNTVLNTNLTGITINWYESQTEINDFSGLSSIGSGYSFSNIDTTKAGTFYYYCVATYDQNGLNLSEYHVYTVTINSLSSVVQKLGIAASLNNYTYNVVQNQNNNLIIDPTISGNLSDVGNLQYQWSIASTTNKDITWSFSSSNQSILTLSSSLFDKVGIVELNLTITGSYQGQSFTLSNVLTSNVIINIISSSDNKVLPDVTVTLNGTNNTSNPLYVLSNNKIYLTSSINSYKNPNNYLVSISYQWYKNGTQASDEISGATSSAYEIDAITTITTYYLYYQVNINGSTTFTGFANGSITVSPYTPTLTLTSPQTSYTIYEYDNKIENTLPTLTINAATALNNSTITYKWYKGTYSSNNSNTAIGTGLSYAITSADLTYDTVANFYVVATYTLNNTTITGYLNFTVTPSILNPSLTLNSDLNQSYYVNQDYNINASAIISGLNNLNSTITYDWTIANTNLNSNTSSISISQKDYALSVAGTYNLSLSVTIVYDGLSITLSSSKQFSVIELDTSITGSVSINPNNDTKTYDLNYIANQTSNTTINPVLNIKTNNLNPSYSFAWYNGDKVIATTSTLNLSDLKLLDVSSTTTYNIYLVVTANFNNSSVTFTSGTDTVTVYSASSLNIAVSPTSNTSFTLLQTQTNNLPTLSAILNYGTLPTGLNISDVSYQWNLNGTAISSATASSYIVPTSAIETTGTLDYTLSVSYSINGISQTTITSSIYSITVGTITWNNNTTFNSTVTNNSTLYLNQTNNLPVFSTNVTASFNNSPLPLTYQWQYRIDHNSSWGTMYTFSNSNSSVFSLSSSVFKSLGVHNGDTLYIRLIAYVSSDNVYGIPITQNLGNFYITAIKTPMTFKIASASENLTVSVTNNNSNSYTIYKDQTSNLPTLNITASALLNGNAYNTNFTYQWYENGAAIANATQSYYSLNTFKTDGTYTYYCIASVDFNGVIVSSAIPSTKITITVSSLTNSDLSISNGTTINATQYETSYQTLTPIITNNLGSGNLTYQWYKNGTAIKGATQPLYTLNESDVDSAVTNSYSLSVTLNFNGATITVTQTTPFSVIVAKAPSFSVKSINTSVQGVVYQSNISLNASIDSDNANFTYSYAWYEGSTLPTIKNISSTNSTASIDWNGSAPSSVYGNLNYLLPAIKTSGTYYYFLIVKGEINGYVYYAISDVYTVNIAAFPDVVVSGTGTVVQNISEIGGNGESITLSTSVTNPITVAGQATLTYHWYKNNWSGSNNNPFDWTGGSYPPSDSGWIDAGNNSTGNSTSSTNASFDASIYNVSANKTYNYEFICVVTATLNGYSQQYVSGMYKVTIYATPTISTTINSANVQVYKDQTNNLPTLSASSSISTLNTSGQTITYPSLDQFTYTYTWQYENDKTNTYLDLNSAYNGSATTSLQLTNEMINLIYSTNGNSTTNIRLAVTASNSSGYSLTEVFSTNTITLSFNNVSFTYTPNTNQDVLATVDETNYQTLGPALTININNQTYTTGGIISYQWQIQENGEWVDITTTRNNTAQSAAYIVNAQDVQQAGYFNYRLITTLQIQGASFSATSPIYTLNVETMPTVSTWLYTYDSSTYTSTGDSTTVSPTLSSGFIYNVQLNAKTWPSLVTIPILSNDDATTTYVWYYKNSSSSTYIQIPNSPTINQLVIPSNLFTTAGQYKIYLGIIIHKDGLLSSTIYQPVPYIINVNNQITVDLTGGTNTTAYSDTTASYVVPSNTNYTINATLSGSDAFNGLDYTNSVYYQWQTLTQSTFTASNGLVEGNDEYEWTDIQNANGSLSNLTNSSTNKTISYQNVTSFNQNPQAQYRLKITIPNGYGGYLTYYSNPLLINTLFSSQAQAQNNLQYLLSQPYFDEGLLWSYNNASSTGGLVSIINKPFSTAGQYFNNLPKTQVDSIQYISSDYIPGTSAGNTIPLGINTFAITLTTLTSGNYDYWDGDGYSGNVSLPANQILTIYLPFTFSGNSTAYNGKTISVSNNSSGTDSSTYNVQISTYQYINDTTSLVNTLNNAKYSYWSSNATWYSAKFGGTNFYLSYAGVLVNNGEGYGSGNSALNGWLGFQFPFTTVGMSLSNVSNIAVSQWVNGYSYYMTNTSKWYPVTTSVSPSTLYSFIQSTTNSATLPSDSIYSYINNNSFNTQLLSSNDNSISWLPYYLIK